MFVDLAREDERRVQVQLEDLVDGLVVTGVVEHGMKLVAPDEPAAVDRALGGLEDRHLDLLHLFKHLVPKVNLGQVVLKCNCCHVRSLLAKQTW